MKQSNRILHAVGKALILSIFLTFISSPCQAFVDQQPGIVDEVNQPPAISAEAAILVDTTHGQVLFGKNTTDHIVTSFANKLMTAHLAIERMKPDAPVVISKESLVDKKPAVLLEAGDKRPLEDLVAAIFLTGSNDAANAAAEFTEADKQKFVEMMNNEAHELKMADSLFSSPSAFSEHDGYTTASDIAVLMRHALGNPAFNRIFSLEAISWQLKQGYKIHTNANTMFWSYDGVDGGTADLSAMNKASAVTCVTRADRRLICIVLNSDTASVFKDSTLMLDYGFTYYRKSKLLSKDEIVRKIQVSDIEVGLISNSDIYYTHPTGDSFMSGVQYDISKDIALPIVRTKIIGTARYTLGDNTVITVNLYPDKEILPPDNIFISLKKKLAENKDILLLIYFLAVIEAVLIIAGGVRLIHKLRRKAKSVKS